MVDQLEPETVLFSRSSSDKTMTCLCLRRLGRRLGQLTSLTQVRPRSGPELHDTHGKGVKAKPCHVEHREHFGFDRNPENPYSEGPREPRRRKP